LIPIQAKGRTDKLSVVQVEQDIAMCKEKFPSLVCRPLGSQFIEENLIALFEFSSTAEGIKGIEERHYRLLHPDELTQEELESFRKRVYG
jgi:hypothetical protein